MSPPSPILPSRLLAGLSTSIAALLVFAVPATATTTTTVNSLGDGNPSCAAFPSDCTLRGAINAAQSSAGDDVINFGVTGTIDLQSALPDLPDGLQINGPGAGQLNVHHSDFFLDPFRIFAIPSGRTVSISGLTASKGRVAASGATYQRADGGGIYNAGNLTLEGVVVRDNLVMANATGPSYPTAVALGAGIINDGGNLTLRGVTVSGNHAVATADGPNAQTSSSGGGIWNAGGVFSAGTLTISNSTITDNVVGASSTGSGATQQAEGGGIQTMSGQATLSGATVTANSGTAGSNISSGGITLRDTIVSNPLGGGDNCSSGFLTVSKGYNLEGGAAPGTCGLTTPTDIHGDPMLGPPAGSGASPFSLLPGSPAIDAGNSFGLTTDQLGQPRPSDFPSTPNAAGGDGSDIGAFEAQAFPSTDTTPPETTITKVKIKAKKHLAIVRFSSSEPRSTFRCKLDKKPLTPCSSPRKLKHLKRGKHRFRVVATDAAGNVDPTPAKNKFKLR